MTFRNCFSHKTVHRENGAVGAALGVEVEGCPQPGINPRHHRARQSILTALHIFGVDHLDVVRERTPGNAFAGADDHTIDEISGFSEVVIRAPRAESRFLFRRLFVTTTKRLGTGLPPHRLHGTRRRRPHHMCVPTCDGTVYSAAQHTLQGAHWSGRALSRSSSSSSTAAVDGWPPASLVRVRITTSSRSSASITSRVRIPLSRCAQGKRSDLRPIR
jgi:hypothetical protein